MCQWVNVANLPKIYKDFFLATDFCHPIMTPGTEPPATEWERCLAIKDGGSCSNSQCAWNKGIELIPDHDYCAPTSVDVDAATVGQCVTTTDPSQCHGDCTWRRGKTVAFNNEFSTSTAEPFMSNFCHPPSTADWDNQAPACLPMMTADNCTSLPGCMWSTGRQLVSPQQTEFCAVRYFSQ